MLWSSWPPSRGFFPKITATEKPGKEAGVQSLRAGTGHTCGSQVTGPSFSGLVLKETCRGNKQGKDDSADRKLSGCDIREARRLRAYHSVAGLQGQSQRGRAQEGFSDHGPQGQDRVGLDVPASASPHENRGRVLKQPSLRLPPAQIFWEMGHLKSRLLTGRWGGGVRSSLLRG